MGNQAHELTLTIVADTSDSAGPLDLFCKQIRVDIVENVGTVNTHAECNRTVAGSNHGNSCRGISKMDMHVASPVFMHPMQEHPCLSKICQPL